MRFSEEFKKSLSTFDKALLEYLETYRPEWLEEVVR